MREIGASNFSVEQIREAEAAVRSGAARFVSIQNEYSLMHSNTYERVNINITLRIASISLLPDLEIKDTQLKLGHHLIESGDVIWIRKPADPKPNPQTAAEDAKFAANEYRSFYHSLMYLLETLPVRVINKYAASRFINNKSVQLLLARDCGMNVPRTLMTNSPPAVREYFRGNPQRTICKTFSTHIWEKEQGGPVDGYGDL